MREILAEKPLTHYEIAIELMRRVPAEQVAAFYRKTARYKDGEDPFRVIELGARTAATQLLSTLKDEVIRQPGASRFESTYKLISGHREG